MQHTNPTLRILKNSTCPTLSEKGTLGYHIAINNNDELFIRVVTNSGSGYFNSEWVPVNSILSLLQSTDKPFTSYALLALFKGKSTNTPAFLFSTLKAEGIVTQDAGNPRCYALLSIDTFMAEIVKLKDSEVSIKVDEPIAKLDKSTPIKKSATTKTSPSKSSKQKS